MAEPAWLASEAMPLSRRQFLARVGLAAGATLPVWALAAACAGDEGASPGNGSLSTGTTARRDRPPTTLDATIALAAETLSVHVLAEMVAAVNALDRSVVTGAPCAVTVVTGDLADSKSTLELTGIWPPSPAATWCPTRA